jgi:hypothetical protein
MRVLIASAALLAVLTTAPAFADDKVDKPKPDRSQRFRVEDINGFNPIDDRTIDVSIGSRHVWRLTLFSPLNDVDSDLRIGIESRGASWVCEAMDVTLLAPGPVGEQRYPVTAVRKLTPEELVSQKKKPKA